MPEGSGRGSDILVRKFRRVEASCGSRGEETERMDSIEAGTGGGEEHEDGSETDWVERETPSREINDDRRNGGREKVRGRRKGEEYGRDTRSIRKRSHIVR